MRRIEIQMNADCGGELHWLYSADEYDYYKNRPDAKIIWSLYLRLDDPHRLARATWIADYDNRLKAESVAADLTSAPITSSLLYMSDELNDLTKHENREPKA